MNAKEISDATLESVTPADNDLMLIYDTSEGTTGKATISAIAPKVAESIDIATLPAVTPAADDVLIIRDASTGTTGKATIEDIINNSQIGQIIDLPNVQLLNKTSRLDGTVSVKFLKLRDNLGIVFCNGSVKNSSQGTVNLSFDVPNVSILMILSINCYESANTSTTLGYNAFTADFYLLHCMGGNPHSTINVRASMICNLI